MDTRATIEGILDKLYAARLANDAKAAADCFQEDGRFKSNGASAAATNRAEQLDALKGLFDAFVCNSLQQHCRVIDPPRAVVHWRGTFRAKNGKVGETDVLDIIEFRDGRAASVTTFYDTAYAAALSA
jgi:ketosteroid isomerase-like protein